jgi:hypothetical protein
MCAARSDDPQVRQRLVDGWRKLFGLEVCTAENVRCDGYRAEGGLADKECQARPCAIARGLESCALCDEFACEKVGHLLESGGTMLLFLHRRGVRAPAEEYRLCARQFESKRNVIGVVADAGRLPPSVMREGPMCGNGPE